MWVIRGRWVKYQGIRKEYMFKLSHSHGEVLELLGDGVKLGGWWWWDVGWCGLGKGVGVHV